MPPHSRPRRASTRQPSTPAQGRGAARHCRSTRSSPRSSLHPLDAERASLDHTFASLGDPVTQAGAGTVKVSLSGEVAVPFGRVLGWLDPSRGNGLVHVSESSYAQSPVAGTGC
jgi:hypothetical protein